jgi:hypothetical protein
MWDVLHLLDTSINANVPVPLEQHSELQNSIEAQHEMADQRAMLLRPSLVRNGNKAMLLGNSWKAFF